MKIKTLLLFLLFSLGMNAQVNKIVGNWDTVDDKTGERRAKVSIYKATDGKYYGKIINLYQTNPDGTYSIMTKYPAGYEQAIGMVILKELVPDGDILKGKCYDPESQKTYYGKVSYNAKNNTITLRGSIDKYGVLGRSQTWLKTR